jgi:two-component system sensor histidine kinase QseC
MPWRTLRGRLAAAMLAILLLALGASALLNAPGRPLGGEARPEAGFLPEPYQDAFVLASFSLAALLLIWFVSSWSLRPLARVSQEARAVGPQSPSARLSRAGLPAEITPLVDAVNGALDRMADAYAAERRFTENAAHELRTPLAVLSLRVQRAQQSAAPDWPAIEHDLAQVNALVAQMLDLARKEHASHAGAERPMINLARIAREACAMALPLLEAQHRSLSADLPETLSVRGDAADLRDAIRNVLENAALHGAGTVSIAAADSAAGLVRLTVSDEGAGPPPELRDHVFERFAKGGSSQGSGLGLAIVREVARGHGGDVVFLAGDRCRLIISVPEAGPRANGGHDG